MKPTHLILSLTALLLAGSAFGQRLKDKWTKITYVSLPEKKLPDSYTTYSVNVYGSTMVEAGWDAESAVKSLNMDGFKRVSHQGRDGGGHLRIVVSTGYVNQGGADMKSEKKVTKDKAGKETVTWSYWYEVPFSVAPTYQIYDPEGNILDSGGANKSEIRKTAAYGNSSTLGKEYKSLLADLRKQFAVDATNETLATVRRSLAKNFDFAKTFDNTEMFLIVNHDTEAEYEKYFEQIDKEWKDLDAATPAQDIKAKFANALAFYEKEAAQDAKGDKKMARVFEASNYNMALLSFYLGDFEEAVRYANRVIANEGGKHKKASTIIERVQATQKLMELHGINSMHYSRDLTNAMAPSATKALELAKEEVAKSNDMLTGTITLNGEAISGTVLSEKASEELDFSEKGNTKFVVEMDGKKVEYKLGASEITEFTIGDRKFFKKKFAPCAKGKPEVGTHILEELYSSPKISLYKYYPSGGALNDAKTEFAFKKAAEENPISLYDTKFLLLKKGLANYFSDCADLKAMCEEGAVEMEQESLLKTARIYAEVCQ